MGTKRTVLLVGLGLVLFGALLAANLAVGAERTVLDPEYTKETAREEGVYELVTARIEERIAGGPDGSGGVLDRSRADLLRSAITEEYVRSQTETNIDRVYAYLRGERSTLRIAIDTVPLKDRLLATVEAEVEDRDLGALPVPRAAEIQAMAENETAFDRRRTEFRERQKARIQTRTDRELSDAELERALDDRLPDIRDRLIERVDGQLEGRLPDQQAPLREPIRALAIARIDALTGAATYEEYATRVDSATATLKDRLVDTIETELDGQFPDTIDLTDRMGSDVRSAAETARQAVSLTSTLALALPVLVVVLIGLLVRIGSAPVAAIEVGIVSGLVGLLSVAGTQAGAARAGTVLAEASIPPRVADVLRGVLAGLSATLTWQSALLAVAGGVLLLAGLAVRRGLVPTRPD